MHWTRHLIIEGYRRNYPCSLAVFCHTYSTSWRLEWAILVHQGGQNSFRRPLFFFTPGWLMSASVSERIVSPIAVMLLIFIYTFGEASAGSDVSPDNPVHLFPGYFACPSLQAENLPSIASSHKFPVSQSLQFLFTGYSIIISICYSSILWGSGSCFCKDPIISCLICIMLHIFLGAFFLGNSVPWTECASYGQGQSPLQHQP